MCRRPLSLPAFKRFEQRRERQSWLRNERRMRDALHKTALKMFMRRCRRRVEFLESQGSCADAEASMLVSAHEEYCNY